MRAKKVPLLALLALLPGLVYVLGLAPSHAPDPPASDPPAPAVATPVRAADPEQQLYAAVGTALSRNLDSRVPVIYPSPAYYNPYLRDSFWAAQALDDRAFSTRVLAVFARAERADGDPPTLFVNAYRSPQYHDDESAALLLIWAWRNQRRYGVTPPRSTLAAALSYLLRRSRGGALVTPAGRYGSWWDVYSLPVPDTLSYTQGLYVVALRAAQGLGLALPRHAIALAEVAYRGLYSARLGYLPLSAHIPASDASALTGEFLSLWLFRRPMLSDAMVLGTLRHLKPFGAGFQVVSLPTTKPGQSSSFAPSPLMGDPGDYQNGASWLLFDALSIAAAGLHGLPDAAQRLRARLALEFRHGAVLHEYLRTNSTLAYYGSAPPYRGYFAWDAFVLVIDRVLHARLHPGQTWVILNRRRWPGS